MVECAFTLNKYHPHFSLPENSDLSIWRYCDISKLISLLDKQALFFCRASELAKEDPYEGALAVSDVARLLDACKDERIAQYNRGIYTKFGSVTGKIVYLNCWHMNEYESAAMWKAYLKSDEGIAIKSSIGRLIGSLASHELPVFIGKVNYIDYTKESVGDAPSIFPAFLCKRKSFEYERELRAAVLDVWLTPFKESGVFVSCEVSTLVESIYVSPAAPSFFLDAVKAICDRFKLNKPVIQSDLQAEPLY